MATYARYYKDDSAAVEFTNYVDLPTLSCEHTIERDLEVIPGNAGGNTYRDDKRYVHKWVIVADVNRRTHDFLRGCAIDDFDSDTALRVYDEYTADYYTDYTGVKLKSYTSKTTDGGNRYTVTLMVVK
jgi:hypothetical protein